MKLRQLGKTDINVSEVGLGAMPLSIGGRPKETDALRVIHTALDAGMTLIDTADAYCLDQRDVGHNERLVARALGAWSGPTRQILIATKGGLERPGGDWTVNAHPKHLAAACEASLTALGVSTIDLYQLHAPDDRVPFADSVGALATLRAQGKIRHIGLSNVNVAQIETAQKIVPIASVQNRCNPFERQAFTTGVVRACEEKGITFLAHSPVGGHRGHARTAEHPILRAVGAKSQLSPYQVCLAWLLGSSPAIVVIPGASHPTSVTSSAAVSGATLSAEDMAALRLAFPT